MTDSYQVNATVITHHFLMFHSSVAVIKLSVLQIPRPAVSHTVVEPPLTYQHILRINSSNRPNWPSSTNSTGKNIQ